MSETPQTEKALNTYYDVIDKTIKSIENQEWEGGMLKMLMDAARMVQKEVGDDNEAVAGARADVERMQKEHNDWIAFHKELRKTAELAKNMLVEITEGKETEETDQ